MRAMCVGVIAASVGLASPSPAGGDDAIRTEGALEESFWICDYLASSRGMPPADMTSCFRITEQLKNKKFGGDLNQMIDWWREKKRDEHLKLHRKERQSPVDRPS